MGDAERILAAFDQAPATVAVLHGTEQSRHFRDLALQVMQSGQQVQMRALPVDRPDGTARLYYDLLIHPLRDPTGARSWRAWAFSPAASPTTSTTCSPSSRATPRWRCPRWATRTRRAR